MEPKSLARTRRRVDRLVCAPVAVGKPGASPGVEAERCAVGPAFADRALVSESFLQAAAFLPAQPENDRDRGASETDCCDEALHEEQKCNPATQRQAQIGPVQRRRLPGSGGLVPTRARSSQTSGYTTICKPKECQ